MKQINTNIFSNIHFDDLEHIRFNIPAFGIAPFPGSLPDFKDLKNFKFTKKYNLLYQNENMESGCKLQDCRGCGPQLFSANSGRDHVHPKQNIV